MYRLLENVYECDENGQPIANLKQCLPVLSEGSAQVWLSDQARPLLHP
jgi:hypothetical protein